MTEQELEENLLMLFDEIGSLAEDNCTELETPVDFLKGGSIKTFENAMLLTDNKGLIFRLADGSEFQLTIVRSH